MKKTIILFTLLLSIHSAFPQSENIDSMLQKIAAEKDDNVRIDLINNIVSGTTESDPVLDIQNAQNLLLLSQNNKDKIAEAMALTGIGYDYMSLGNTAKLVEKDRRIRLAMAKKTIEKLEGNNV